MRTIEKKLIAAATNDHPTIDNKSCTSVNHGQLPIAANMYVDMAQTHLNLLRLAETSEPLTRYKPKTLDCIPLDLTWFVSSRITEVM